MTFLSQALKSHLDVVFFFYGLAFLIMGIAILLQPRKESGLKLASILWLLAGFGITHGINEVMDMWVIIKGSNDIFNALRCVMIVSSFIYLFEFGRRLFLLGNERLLQSSRLFSTVFSGWVPMGIALIILISHHDFCVNGTILARYLLGFPGAFLSGMGIILYYYNKSDNIKTLNVKKQFIFAGIFFILYAVLSGLIVPKADFFPANIINHDTFFSLVKIPVQVFRALCSLIIAWAVCSLLNVFNLDLIKRLKESGEVYRAKETLQQLEKEFENIRNASLIGVYKTNLKGDIIYANQTWLKMLEFDSLQEAAAQGILKRYHNLTDREILLEKLKFEGRVNGFEVDFVTKKGKIKRILLSAYLEEGVISGIMVDITGRKKAEESLKETRDFLDNLFNYANSPIIVWDSAFKITRFNHAAERLTGYKAGVVINRKLDFILPADSRDESMKKFSQTLNGEFLEAIEIPVLHEDGSIRIVLWNTANVYDEKDKNILATIAQGQDITSRKKTEEELKLAAQRWRTTFDAINSAICLLDKENKILLYNKNMAELVGKKYGEIIGNTCCELIHGDPHPLDGCPLQRMRKSLVRETLTLKIGERWFDVIADPIFDEMRALTGAVHIVTEITDFKKAQEELQLKARLLDASMDTIILSDFSGDLLYANEAAYKSRGYSCDEFFKLKFHQLANVENSRQASFGIEDLLIKGGVLFESLHVCKDGSAIPVEVSSRVIDYSEKKVVLSIIREISERKKSESELKRSYEKLQRILEETVDALASAVEKRDPYTTGHQKRVAQLAYAIAKEMKFNEEQLEEMRLSGLLHDVGKIAIPSDILSKPGQLTEYEFSIIKTHAKVGFDILKDLEFPWPIAKIVLQHHERMNGSGYPDGLTGDKILLEARILAVADVVEAMSSHRPYRPAHGIDKALEEISHKRGILYDQDVVDACIKVFTEKIFKLE